MPARKTTRTKKELILSEAAKLFKERGFGGTSMRDLAEKVGIEAASMYNHIRSKEEILEDICFRIAREYVAQLSEIEHAEMTYQDKLRALIRLHVRMITADAHAISVTNNDWKYLSEPKMTHFKEIRKDYERRFAALIQKGIEAGEFRPVNVSVALFTILSSLRWVELWYKADRRITIEILEQDITAILMNGINV
jgi:TetR/AcrR family transcriptional regulator, cholesterol catabolism regulator